MERRSKIEILKARIQTINGDNLTEEEKNVVISLLKEKIKEVRNADNISAYEKELKELKKKYKIK